MLAHGKKALRRYETIAGTSSRDELPEVGPLAQKLRAYRLAVRAGNIWKAIKGEARESRGPWGGR